MESGREIFDGKWFIWIQCFEIYRLSGCRQMKNQNHHCSQDKYKQNNITNTHELLWNYLVRREYNSFIEKLTFLGHLLMNRNQATKCTQTINKYQFKYINMCAPFCMLHVYFSADLRYLILWKWIFKMHPDWKITSNMGSYSKIENRKHSKFTWSQWENNK